MSLPAAENRPKKRLRKRRTVAPCRAQFPSSAASSYAATRLRRRHRVSLPSSRVPSRPGPVSILQAAKPRVPPDRRPPLPLQLPARQLQDPPPASSALQSAGLQQASNLHIRLQRTPAHLGTHLLDQMSSSLPQAITVYWIVDLWTASTN